MASYGSELAAALKAAGLGANTSFTSDTSYDMNLGGIFGTLAVSALVVLLVLIAVHYTITPIFRFRPGGKGYITVPGITRDDGEIYWNNEYPHGPLSEQSTMFSGTSDTSFGYTLSIDFFFLNLSSGIDTSQKLRPLLYRYNPAGTSTDGVPDYTLGMFLDPTVNDIHVIIRTTQQDQELIVVKNIVSQEPIRIGVVVGENYFEVYKNGRLVATRRLRNPPKQAAGTIWADPGSVPGGIPQPRIASNPDIQCKQINSGGPLGGAVNLHIWKRNLSPGELKYSTPALPAASLFKEAQAKKTFLGIF
jgi:hypothetical protein